MSPHASRSARTRTTRAMQASPQARKTVARNQVATTFSNHSMTLV